MAPEPATGPRFGTVALDVDSTLAGIEGIDWLAARRGPGIEAQVRSLTEAAMSGRVSIGDVYAERLSVVAPTSTDVTALSQAYCDAIAPGARACIVALREAGVRVIIMSSAVRSALGPLARAVGIAVRDVHAVAVHVDDSGAYAGFDRASPLTQADGKARLLHALADELPRPLLHVGDGATDAAARGVADGFAAYTGFVERKEVVTRADFVVPSFVALRDLVLGSR